MIAKLTAGIKQALEPRQTNSRAATSSVELRYQPLEALAALVTRKTEFWAKTIKSAGITAD